MAADRAIEAPGGASRLYELLRVPGALLIDGSPDSSWSSVAAAAPLRVVSAPGGRSLLIRPDAVVAWGAPPGARASDDETLAGELSAAVARWLGELVLEKGA